MDCLNSKIEEIRSRINKNQEEDSVLRAQIKDALKVVFCCLEGEVNVICDIHLKNGILTLKAKNKAFANELFLRKSEFINAFEGSKNIKEIVIK